MSTQNDIQTGRALLDALTAHDLSRWAAALADDATVSYPGLRGNYNKAAAQAYNAPFITAFSDLRMDVHKVIANGDTIVYLWTGSGTHDGPLPLPTGTVPPTGKHGQVDGVLVTTIKDGKIVREETYWNQIELLAQLGLMPGA